MGIDAAPRAALDKNFSATPTTLVSERPALPAAGPQDGGPRQAFPVDVSPGPGYPWSMSALAQAVLEQALRLSADERANLADALTRSLADGGAAALPAADVARLWNDEIERRLARARARVARGEPTGRTADEVFADAEARIQATRASRGG